MRQATFAARAAYAAALFFALHLFTYFIPSIRDATLATSATVAILLGVLAVVQHLVVFPVVAALPAPRWAQVAAYVWLVIDLLTDLAQVGGAAKSVYLVARLLVNVLAALWIVAASLQQRGAARGIGLFVAIDTVLYSLLGGFIPWAFVVTLPSLVLFPVWFFLVGRWLMHNTPPALPVQAIA